MCTFKPLGMDPKENTVSIVKDERLLVRIVAKDVFLLSRARVAGMCLHCRYQAIDVLLLSAFVAGMCLPSRCLAVGVLIHVTV